MGVHSNSASTDPMIGLIVRDFVIVEKLAEGGMGAVYLARHQDLPETRKVIKVLLPEYAQNPIIRQRFEREAKAVSRLKHSNILGIDGYGTLDDGQLFLMIPYLEGQPLDAYLRSKGGRLSEHRALHIVIQLCDALDHAHTNGIVHRDLKPGNVFVVPTNRNPYEIKLLDFGISKMLGETVGPVTKSGIAIGTPAYMAVEQYEHADEATHLADVYSLAIMIYEMVTGALPWTHHDQAVLYFQQRTVVPTRPPLDVMAQVWTDILLAALSVDPRSRPQSVRELAVALASALPSIGRVPSGAEILADLAPHFIHNAAPSSETVRNASNHDRLGPLLWPTRETAPGAGQSLPPLNVATSSEMWAGTPAMPATANQRPPVSPPTTLSSSTGAVSALAEKRLPRWKLAVAAGGACVFAALVTVVIATRASIGEDTAGRASSAGIPEGTSSASVDAGPRLSTTVTPDAAPMQDAASEATLLEGSNAAVGLESSGDGERTAPPGRGSDAKQPRTAKSKKLDQSGAPRTSGRKAINGSAQTPAVKSPANGSDHGDAFDPNAVGGND